jgi:MFS family permease
MSSAAQYASPSASRQTLGGRGVTTDIPARLDRLPWSRFHLLVTVALGVTWILDGLEVTIVGAIAPVLQNSQTLGLSAGQIGAAASAYVTGAVVGALLFGWLTDRFGRRLVFYVTLVVYLVGVLLTATSWSFWSFALFRAVTGLGIGGEYAAINSAIDELIPARYRGRIDLIVNGSFWVGAAAGAGASLLFLDPNVVAPNLGWRLGFAIGGLLGLGIRCCAITYRKVRAGSSPMAGSARPMPRSPTSSSACAPKRARNLTGRMSACASTRAGASDSVLSRARCSANIAAAAWLCSP